MCYSEQNGQGIFTSGDNELILQDEYYFMYLLCVKLDETVYFQVYSTRWPT